MKSGIRWAERPISIAMSEADYPGIEGRRNKYVLHVYRSPDGRCWTGKVSPFTQADVSEGFNLLCKRLGVLAPVASPVEEGGR